jgi:hypothetical protein
MKTTIILLSAIIFTSCNSLNNKEENVYKEINLTLKPSKYDLYSYDDFFYGVSCYKIPTDIINIGNVDKIETNNESIFIVDLKLSKSILCMDFAGNIKFIINKIGKGSGEYINIDDFCVSEKSLFVYSGAQKKIIEYSVENGDFLREKKISFDFRSFAVTDKYTYFLLHPRKGTEHWLYIKNNENSKIIKKLPFSEYPIINLPERRNNFFKRNDTIILVHSYQETIFKIYNENVEPYIKLNAGDKSLFKQIEMWPNETKKDRMMIKEKSYTSFGDFFENKKFLYFNFSTDGIKLQHVIFNKETSDYVIQKGFRNDFLFTSATLFRINNGSAVSKIGSDKTYWIKKNGIDKSKIISPNKDIFDNLEIKDNPVIVIYHEKK